MLGKTVAKNVKLFRLQAGMSQQKLADKTRLSVRYISRLENKGPNVTLDIIDRMSRGLECTAADLVSETKKKTGTKSKGLKKSIDDAIQTLEVLKVLAQD